MNYRNKSLEKTFEIIEALSVSPTTPSNLAKDLGINRSTLHRFLQNLEELQYVEKLPDHRIRLSHRFIRIGHQAQSHFHFITVAKPIMKTFADRIGECVFIASFNGRKVTYLEKAESSQTVRIVIEAGGQSPPYAVASGKLFLSELSEKDLNQFLKRTELKPYTTNTITEKNDLRRELRRIKQNGYSLDDEEYEIGLKGFACPIRDVSGSTVAAFCVAGVALRFDEKKVNETIELLKYYSNEISMQLGYPGYHTTISGDQK
ncbi:IclR family transcriptional regulator [Alkalihalobacterium alkalinitrilicum]|uniref:IclR family transcriptional regulator n=1 Tax=Alkalihalobacterium alkalinitrilicum TaxID=427920 RepID=UPI001154E1E3|nr:IclR family transcriptional regulator [Alkalihalobacterium alkalinitrilicum]